jgi:hypothetical protein
VQRTSNAFAFNDPSSKFKFQTETTTQAANERKVASNGPAEPVHNNEKLWTMRRGWQRLDGKGN